MKNRSNEIRSNEIRSNEIRIRQELPVFDQISRKAFKVKDRAQITRSKIVVVVQLSKKLQFLIFQTVFGNRLLLTNWLASLSLGHNDVNRKNTHTHYCQDTTKQIQNRCGEPHNNTIDWKEEKTNLESSMTIVCPYKKTEANWCIVPAQWGQKTL